MKGNDDADKPQDQPLSEASQERNAGSSSDSAAAVEAEQVQRALRRFVQINLDSALGFETAAADVADPQLSASFVRIAEMRRAHMEELQRLADDRSAMTDAETTEPRSSFLASLHRMWIDVRSWLTAGDTYAVLAEVERGEDEIQAVYEKVLPSLEEAAAGRLLRRQHEDIRHLVAEQFAEVRRTHDRMRDLRDDSLESAT